MQDTAILEKAGLTNKESIIYAALLDDGPCTISTLYKKTGIHRALLYKELPSLEEKGLISVMPKGKRKYYIAESPTKLRNLAATLMSEIDTILPELTDKFESKQKRPVIKFLEGKKGLTFVFEDILTTLKHGDIYYRYTSESEKDLTKANKYLPKNFRERRDKKQIERFVIANESTFSRKKMQKSEMNRSLKMIPKEHDLFEYDISQFIYANKVAYVDYNSETALIVENENVANFQKKIFKLLFKKL